MSPHICVIGNEKGGVGKSTCAMHLISTYLNDGFKVASIDIDVRQKSLSTYLKYREQYNKNNPEKPIPMPNHFIINQDATESDFSNNLDKAITIADIVIIDTPGSNTNLSQLAHSYADTVITPVNDSFLDLSILGNINTDNLDMISPSIYSENVWKQKLKKANRKDGSLNWVVMRNRINNMHSINKQQIEEALQKLSQRLGFRIIHGFTERVIFKELFLHGLTLVDLKKANYNKPFSLSHVAARQELKQLITDLNINKK